jgi:hypothetical protein
MENLAKSHFFYGVYEGKPRLGFYAAWSTICQLDFDSMQWECDD